MAIGFLQSAAGSQSTTATTLPQAFSGAVVPNNSLFAFAWTNQTTSLAVADSVNGSYTPVGTQLVGVGGNATWTLQAFWLPATLAGTPTVTVTCGASCTFRAVAVGEYSGVGAIEDFTYANTALAVSPASAPAMRSWARGDVVISIIMPTNSVTAIASPYNTRQIASFAAGAYGDNLAPGLGPMTAMSATLNMTSDVSMLTLVLSQAAVAGFAPARMPLGV